MTSKHPLRRSCAFCRARKIKCSNEPICEACRRQGADCIYDFEAPRPKGRAGSQDSVRSESVTRHGDVTSAPHRHRSSTVCSSTTGSPVPEDLCHAGDAENIALCLEQKFFDNFSPDVGRRSSPWHHQITTYTRSLRSSSRDRRSKDLSLPFNPQSIKHTGLLSLLAQDLASLVTDQLGSLGNHHIEQGGAKLFLSGLASDDAQTMFDNTPITGNPLSEYGQRQQTQLIDVWFSSHPLSFLVSKTLLLRELRDGTHDEILLAAMLADANLSIGNEVAVARGHMLLQWATAQLRNRSLRTNHYSPNGTSGVSTRIFSGLSTAQALMLLGWSALCSGQMRRFVCYAGLACRIVTEIQEQIASTTTPVSSSRINGIDVFDVEKEIVAYLYWTTYSLNLWAFMQMGPGDLSGLLPTSLSSIFLPDTEASSVIIQLDLVSDNFSTLQKQKAAIREMWPLAHIVSAIAYMYAQHPRASHNIEASPASLWQEGPLQTKTKQDIASICREISSGLADSIHLINGQVTEISSRSLVLLVYHILAIHVLFPASDDLRPINADMLERFCTSAQEILHIFSIFSTQPDDLFSLAPALRSSFPRVFGLALDTCGRAVTLMTRTKQTGRIMMDVATMNAYDTSVEALATHLYNVSKDDFLNQGTSMRMARKELKAGLRALRGRASPASSNSGASSPAMTHGSLSSVPHSPLQSPRVLASPAESDHMSTASTVIMDPSGGMALTSKTGFSPLREMHKPEWQSTDEIFHNAMDPNAMSQNALGINLQNTWLPQMSNVMEVDMSNTMAEMQWNWPNPNHGINTASAAAASSEVDSLLYYFEQQHQQQTMRA
jgi:hypothetical protein